MAKYKVLLDGETQMYTDIENRMLDLALCKGIACDDTSLENSERDIEEMLERENAERRDSYDGRRSSNSELLKSVRSSRDFWNEKKLRPTKGDKAIARAKEFLDKKREEEKLALSRLSPNKQFTKKPNDNENEENYNK